MGRNHEAEKSGLIISSKPPKLTADVILMQHQSTTQCPHLLQWCIGDAEAAEAHVSQRLLQLPEQAGIRPVFEALIGQQVGQLLADHLDQLGFGDVVVDEGSDAVYIPWEEDHHLWRIKRFPKIAQTKKETKEGKLLILPQKNKHDYSSAEMKEQICAGIAASPVSSGRISRKRHEGQYHL